AGRGAGGRAPQLGLPPPARGHHPPHHWRAAGHPAARVHLLGGAQVSRRILAALLLVAGVVLGTTAPAHAAASVSVSGPGGAASAAPAAATTVTVSGRGFTAIKAGFGGVYVAFGWVADASGGSWRPSRGGITGEDYRYVPDTEGRENAGRLRYVAFPGSSTAGEANGG